MHPLATLWSPDPNLTGQWSIAAALISAFSWFATERRWFRNGRWNDWITAVSPFVPLALILGSKLNVDGSPLGLSYGFSRRGAYWDAESNLAIYILVAAALILSWKGVRLTARDLRLFGLAALAMSLGILAIEFVTLVDIYTRF